MGKAATLSKCSRSLSFEHTVLLIPLANTLAIDRELFSCLVEAGFVIVVPFYHGDFKLNSVGVSTKIRHVCDDRKRLKMDQSAVLCS